MNVCKKILDLNFQHSGENAEINELFITIITKYQLFEPCRYLSEDDEWVNVVMVSLDNEDMSQAMSIRKSEITMIGIFNENEIELSVPQTNPEDFYQ